MIEKSKVNLPKPKPCPFCDGMEFGQKFGPLQQKWWLECYTCQVQGPPHRDDVESINLWNTREKLQGEPYSCPFCGHMEFKQLFSPEQQLWWIECATCQMQGSPHPSKVESVDLWKMRIGSNGS